MRGAVSTRGLYRTQVPVPKCRKPVFRTFVCPFCGREVSMEVSADVHEIPCTCK